MFNHQCKQHIDRYKCRDSNVI